MATLTMNFIGEHYKVYRVSMPNESRDWSQATATTTVRPNPFSYSNNYSDNIIVADNGYKITRVDFSQISGGLEIASDYVNENYPNLEIEGVPTTYFFADYGVTIGSLTGVAFHTSISSTDDDFSWNIDVMVEEDAPISKPYNVLNNTIPDHYILADADISYEGDTFFSYTEIDVSQLNYSAGDTFPPFALIVERGYQVDDPYAEPAIKLNETVSGNVTANAWQNGEDPIQVAYVFESTAKMPDSSVEFSPYFPLPEPTLYSIPRTVTLNRSFCTADKSDSVIIDDGTNYTVNFTAEDGYIFKSEPYCQWGIDTILGEIIDSTHASITLEQVDADLTIYAVCEKNEEPQPTPSTGLVFTRIYNPTFSQLKEAANSLFIDLDSGTAINLQQYIISVHKLFCPVPTNELSEPIRFWRYNTGVASKVINQTEVTLSCGKVTIPEMWHNALDYSPYTAIRIWLPFLGFFDLSINEMMREEIELTYTIDILSGKALAEIKHEDIVIYRFVGTAKAEEPYYVEAGHNISQAYINGAYNMADFTPYLLLDRPQNLTPADTSLHGQPTYRIVTIGDCTGYIRCEQVFAVGMTATDEEKQEIESLLKQGVLVD